MMRHIKAIDIKTKKNPYYLILIIFTKLYNLLLWK
jgi:hypothetical protein